jgi:hypothetical protein
MSTDELKWGVLGVIGVAFAIAAMGFAPDSISQRIAACMTQPGMQFVDDRCIPVANDQN